MTAAQLDEGSRTPNGMQYWGDHVKNVSCPGIVQSLDTPCNGTCNKASQDLKLIRSRLFCDKDKCVEDTHMCAGTQLCQDETDMKLCMDDKMREKACPDIHSWRCQGRNPGQCVPEKNKNDGMYHCLDRADETPLKRISLKKLTVDSMEKCEDVRTRNPNHREGFICSECEPRLAWCQVYLNQLCSKFEGRRLNDADLCNNPSFWSQQPCPEDTYHCTGRNNGQCGSVIMKSLPTCDDKSDQIFSIGRPCNRSKDGNTRMVGTLNCEGSCSSVGCIEGACSNPDYPRCEVDGKCYEPSLRCDMHPQCSDGEDEMDCIQAYRQNNLLPAEASFPCKSPHYPNMVDILAVRCDSISECYGNLDEEDCKQPLIPIESIGNKTCKPKN